MMREDLPLVLFGGTFDPVHRAHIQVALALSTLLGDAPVRLLPNAVPPHRPQPLASGEQRMAMLALACAAHPHLHPDDWELRQSGPSFSLATLQHFRQQIGNKRPLVWLVGADSFASLQHWHRWQDYSALCHLAVAPRPGSNAAIATVCQAFPTASATDLCEQPAGRRLMLESPLLDVSASAVRQALAENGHSDALIPEVLAHIRRHHLYNVANIAQNR